MLNHLIKSSDITHNDRFPKGKGNVENTAHSTHLGVWQYSKGRALEEFSNKFIRYKFVVNIKYGFITYFYQGLIRREVPLAGDYYFYIWNFFLD